MTAIAEKYSRSINSSHLETKRWFEPADLDIFIAAGTLHDGLGVGLLRLRAEFDSICMMPGARTMLTRLKSAGSVRIKLEGLIVDRGGNESTARDLAARIMDHWCDANCPACSGRGQVGNYGCPQAICQTCSGSRVRLAFWEESEKDFAAEIESTIAEMVAVACRRIWKLTRQD